MVDIWECRGVQFVGIHYPFERYCISRAVSFTSAETRNSIFCLSLLPSNTSAQRSLKVEAVIFRLLHEGGPLVLQVTRTTTDEKKPRMTKENEKITLLARNFTLAQSAMRSYWNGSIESPLRFLGCFPFILDWTSRHGFIQRILGSEGKGTWWSLTKFSMPFLVHASVVSPVNALRSQTISLILSTSANNQRRSQLSFLSRVRGMPGCRSSNKRQNSFHFYGHVVFSRALVLLLRRSILHSHWSRPVISD